MKNISKSIFLVLTYIIAFVVYSLFVFLIFPFFHGNNFWISYIFTFTALFLSFVLSYMVFIKNISPTNRFLGLSLPQVGIIYTCIQIVVSFIFMAWNQLSIMAEIFIEIILLMLTAIVLISTQTARNSIENFDNDMKVKREFTLYSVKKLEILILRVSDPDTRKALQILCDKIRYSDPVSGPELKKIEALIMQGIEQAKNFVQSSSWEQLKILCSKLSLLVEERNMCCKNNK